MYSKQILFVSCLLFSQLTPSSPVPADAQTPMMTERSASALDDAVIASNGPQYYINKGEPNKNVTCKASDTACVMGKAPPSQKRDDEDAIPEYLEAEIDRRAMSIQQASQAAGINSLQSQQQPNVTTNATSTTTSASSSATSGICKASDTKCVVGAREAEPESQAEADFDPVAVRIAELQAELEDIRGKRAMLMKREPVPSATFATVTTTITSASTTITATATLNGTSTVTTSTGFPRSTNAWGRVVCKASDTECVTGAT